MHTRVAHQQGAAQSVSLGHSCTVTPLVSVATELILLMGGLVPSAPSQQISAVTPSHPSRQIQGTCVPPDLTSLWVQETSLIFSWCRFFLL